MPSTLIKHEIGSALAADSLCVLCKESLARSKSEFDVILAERDDFLLVPALGMMVPGYFLLTTEDHQQSMAQVGRERLRNLSVWVSELTEVLSPLFGDYFLFEHGDCATESGGSCIDHAHLHLVPLAKTMEARLLRSVAWERLDNLTALTEYSATSYHYLMLGGQHYVLTRPGLGSQWVRRMIGLELNRDDWDWAVSSGEHELLLTLETLGREDLRVKLPA